MYDNNLVLRSAGAGNLTSTETSSALTINETPIAGLALEVIVPSQSSGTTLSVTLQESTDATTWLAAAQTVEFFSSVTVTTSPAVHKRIRFATRAKYIRTVCTVLGTSPNYGAIQLFLGDKDFQNNYTTSPATTLQTV